MKFSELADHSKDTARAHYTGEGFLDYEWWDSIYEDAITAAEILGIEFNESKHEPNKRMPTGFMPAVYFTGFSSQGDGASFAGEYRYAANAAEKIQVYCPDVELLRIAKELTTKQITQRFLGLAPIAASITASGNYCHSSTMNVCIDFEDTEEYDEALEKSITMLMRDFADWIYKQLSDEYDYLHSPKSVDQTLEDLEFDAFGSII